MIMERQHLKGFDSRYWTEPGAVYLLCLSGTLGGDRHRAEHYLGWSNDLDNRVREHRNGRGSKFTQAACQRGFTLRVAEVWTGTRYLEKSLKQSRNLNRFCPICQSKKDVTNLGHLPDRVLYLGKKEERGGAPSYPSLAKTIR